MKKVLFTACLVLAMAAMIYAADTKAVKKIRSGTYRGTQALLNDTLVGADTIYVPLQMFAEFQEGYYRFQYIVDSIDVADFGNGVKLRFEETLDTLYGWENTQTIDSIVAPESTLVIDSTYIHGTDWARFALYSDLTASTDSVHVILLLQALPAP